jgi:hypothetical protein
MEIENLAMLRKKVQMQIFLTSFAAENLACVF